MSETANSKHVSKGKNEETNHKTHQAAHIRRMDGDYAQLKLCLGCLRIEICLRIRS